MVLIIGEVSDFKVRIGFLESFTDTWEGHGFNFQVKKYQPHFLTLDLSPWENRVSFIFRSSKGIIRKGSVVVYPKTAWVVSCNNPHVVRPCTIWPKILERPADVLFHLGDQIYADRIYWKWWRSLSRIDTKRWDRYRDKIQQDYYEEYYQTWEPLHKILSCTSNIMIPDDHEIRSKAQLLKYCVLNRNSICELESFLFQTALEVCRTLYLGLRITQTSRLDYFGIIGDVAVVLHERITQPFLNLEFLDGMKKFVEDHSRILFMSGLPPVQIQPSLMEKLLHLDAKVIPEEDFQRLYECFSGKEVILIGGDLHVGVEGMIPSVGKFHICGPASGFCSVYIPSNCIGSRAQIQKYGAMDSNAVWVDLEKFESEHIFNSGGLADAWQNTLWAALYFWF